MDTNNKPPERLSAFIKAYFPSSAAFARELGISSQHLTHYTKSGGSTFQDDEKLERLAALGLPSDFYLLTQKAR